MEDKRVFMVYVVDEWNNAEYVGLFRNLDSAIPEINKCIVNEKFHLKPGDVGVYPSTLCECFDTSLTNIFPDEDPYDEGNEDLLKDIKGFILDEDMLKDIK